MKGRIDVFLSYARGDDEPFVKRLYEFLISHKFGVWWDRTSMPSRGLKFTQEIRDAIQGAGRLILVVGPHAMRSEYVNAEWQYALKACKVINPVLRSGNYELIPAEIGVHAIDCRPNRREEAALAELLDKLRQAIPELGALHNVPALPPHFLPRPQEISALKDSVLADVNHPIVITWGGQTTTLQGMGGVGKSVLAAALARTCEVRRAFIDGVVWLNFGQRPNVLNQLRSIGWSFGDDLKNYFNVASSRQALAALLESKNCLLVLDDVWDVDHVEIIHNSLGPRCRALLTTRDSSLVQALGAHEHPLDVLTDAEALSLLAEWCRQPVESLPRDARDVVKECGNLPLALAMVGAMVRGNSDRWGNVLSKLRNAQLEKIGQKFSNYLYPDLLRAMKVSVDVLEPNLRARYFDLAVFSGNVAIAETVLETFWRPDGLNKFDVQDVTDALVARSLARRDEAGRLTLHDLQRDYIRKQNEDDERALHNRLLHAYAGLCPRGWPSGPNDGYYFEHLAHHLLKAGRDKDCYALLMNFEWAKAKLAATDIAALVADYENLADDADVTAIRQALRLAAHVLAVDPSQLASQLHGRLQAAASEKIRDFLRQTVESRGAAWLRPLSPSLRSPGELLSTLVTPASVRALAITSDGKTAVAGWEDKDLSYGLRIWNPETGSEVRVLHGHKNTINSVAITPDGRRAVSASDDDVLKVWDLISGTELRTLRGHTHRVWDVAMTPDGRLAVSVSIDDTIRVWDLDSGAELHTLRGHADMIIAVDVASDGRRAITASADTTLKVWDLERGEEVRTLSGHAERVMDVAVSPDGNLAVSASFDKTLKVWDVERGEELLSLGGHAGQVEAVAITADGRRALSGSTDHTLKLWDLETGTEMRTLRGHTGNVHAVAITPDGSRAISAGWDETLRVWDLESEHAQKPYRHDRWVNCVAVSESGRRVVSASSDGKLKVWDLDSKKELLTLVGHTETIASVAITKDGKRVISASHDTSVRVWDLVTGRELQKLEGHTWWVKAVAITADGGLAISASDSEPSHSSRCSRWDDGRTRAETVRGTIIVWDLKRNTAVQRLDSYSSVTSNIALTPDGRRAVWASGDNTLKVWDLKSDSTPWELRDDAYAVSAVALTPDGRRAIWTPNDGTFRVCDLGWRKRPRTFQREGQAVNAVALTPDENRVVLASLDNTLSVYDLNGFRKIATFLGETNMTACAVAADGKIVIAGEESGQVHFLYLEEGG